jgi:hypothetical protein
MLSNKSIKHCSWGQGGYTYMKHAGRRLGGTAGEMSRSSDRSSECIKEAFDALFESLSCEKGW